MKKGQENGPVGTQKRSDRKSNRSREEIVKWNDSPEIPERGETSDIPGLPLGAALEDKVQH